MKIIKKQQNKDIIQNDLKITKTNHLQGANGITLIALVITILFSYDEKLKFSNSKGFLLQTI